MTTKKIEKRVQLELDRAMENHLSPSAALLRLIAEEPTCLNCKLFQDSLKVALEYLRFEEEREKRVQETLKKYKSVPLAIKELVATEPGYLGSRLLRQALAIELPMSPLVGQFLVSRPVKDPQTQAASRTAMQVLKETQPRSRAAIQALAQGLEQYCGLRAAKGGSRPLHPMRATIIRSTFQVWKEKMKWLIDELKSQKQRSFPWEYEAWLRGIRSVNQDAKTRITYSLLDSIGGDLFHAILDLRNQSLQGAVDEIWCNRTTPAVLVKEVVGKKFGVPVRTLEKYLYGTRRA